VLVCCSKVTMLSRLCMQPAGHHVILTVQPDGMSFMYVLQCSTSELL
jgi:hypothetical protein